MCKDIERLNMTLTSTIVEDEERYQVTAEGYLDFRKVSEESEPDILEDQGLKDTRPVVVGHDLSGTLYLRNLTTIKESGGTAVAAETGALPFTLTSRGEFIVDEDAIEEYVEQLGENFDGIELSRHLNKIFPLLPERPVAPGDTWKAEHDDILFDFQVVESGQSAPPALESQPRQSQQQSQQQSQDEPQGSRSMGQQQNLVVIRGVPADPGEDDEHRGTIEMRFNPEQGYMVLYLQDTTNTDSGFFGWSTYKISRTVTFEEAKKPETDQPEAPGRQGSGDKQDR